MKYFCIYFFVLSVFSSCGDCEKLSLSPEESAWVEAFKPGQVTYYKGENDFDTLEVVNVSDKYTPCNKFELSNYQFEVFEVGFKFRSKNLYNLVEPSITMTTREWMRRIPYIFFGNLGPCQLGLENKIAPLIDNSPENFYRKYKYDAKAISARTRLLRIRQFYLLTTDCKQIR